MEYKWFPKIVVVFLQIPTKFPMKGKSDQGALPRAFFE